MMAHGRIGVRQRIGRVERERALEQHQRPGHLRRHAGIDVLLRLQHEIVGVQAVRPLAPHALDLGAAQTGLDRADDVERDLVLQREHVVERAVEALAPQLVSALGIDHLRGDADAAAVLAHASLHQIAHAQRAGDLLHVDRHAPVGEAGMARDDEQPFDARQSGDDVLDHAVGEIGLFRIAAEIGEGQHRDGRFVRQDGRRRRRRGGRGAGHGDRRPDIAIAATRQRLDPVRAAGLAERPAQGGDLDGQVAVLDGQPRPGRFEQRVLGDGRAGVFQKLAQQCHGALAKDHRLAVAKQDFGGRVEPERTEFVSRRHGWAPRSEMFSSFFAAISRPVGESKANSGGQIAR